jgi:hypothetical protein
MNFDVRVEHPDFGEGDIIRVGYDTGDPIVSVKWDNGKYGYYSVDELEFLVI